MQSSPLRNFEQNLISLISNSFKVLETFVFPQRDRGRDKAVATCEELMTV